MKGLTKQTLAIFLALVAIFLTLGLVACNADENTDFGELEYEINDDGISYSVSGIGTLKKRDFEIPSTYNGKPVTAIAPYAFKRCNNLLGVTIPEGVTKIDIGAFSQCYNLKRVTIPNSVTSVGIWVFDRCDKLEYNGGYLGNSENPFHLLVEGSYGENASINENTRIIYASAFYFHEGLYNITIPDSVISISDGAFSQCKNLRRVTLGSGLKEIGYAAFLSCGNLESIVIPDGVTSIGGNAFAGTSITNISIPDSVTTVGDGAFSGVECKSIDGALYLGNENNPYHVLVRASSSTIHKNTKIIYSEAFSDKSELTEITIPDGVTQIGEKAFAKCNNLTSITIPSSIQSIGEGAFSECWSINKKNYTGTVEDWCNINFNAGGANHLYISNQPLTELVIPNTITTIKDYAFIGCSSITSVSMGDNVVKIGKEAFYGCDGLEYFTTGNGVISIGDGAFQSCDNLVNATLGNSVTTIGERAFSNCGKLKNISIPNSIKFVGGDAFDSCQSLKYNIYEMGRYLGNSDNPYVVAIQIGSNVINEGTRVIGSSAFYKNNTIESIVIPDSVVTISDNAFRDCSKLENVTIGNGVTIIGEMAFRDCGKLCSITIGDSVSTICDYAFYGCKLTYIVMPKSINVIKNHAFPTFFGFKYLYYKGSDLEWGAVIIDDGNGGATDLVFFYSETEPTYDSSDLNYWHYVDGVITDWRVTLASK